MKGTLKEGVKWVGYVDWDVRDFHGYRTDRGSSYNSYLIIDKSNALIDSVKEPFVSELLENISKHIDISSLKYIICNHAEPDHSGGLPALLKAIPNASVVCNAKCKDALERHYDTSAWNFNVVSDGDTLMLGKRTLMFIDTPMVHWPESMSTYIKEDKILFSMDAFGQHYASSFRFDDMVEMDVLMSEAKTYYANIVMLYGRQIIQVLDKLSSLDIDIIAPSHGVIWRKYIDTIINEYRNWVDFKSSPKVLIVYDSMWHSTEKMANTIADGIIDMGAKVQIYNVRSTNLTTLVTEVLDSACLAFGSPTLNTSIMPQMSAFMTYLKGLRPKSKYGLAFGSYGWAKAKGGAHEIELLMKDMKIELLRERVSSRFKPDESVLKECYSAGVLLGKKALEVSSLELPR